MNNDPIKISKWADYWKMFFNPEPTNCQKHLEMYLYKKLNLQYIKEKTENWQRHWSDSETKAYIYT